MLSCVRISGVHEEVGGRDDGLGFGSGASQQIFRRKLPNKANLSNEFFTRRSRQVTPCSLANNNMPSTTAPPLPIPTLTSLTSHLSTPRLQQAVHPHRWTPLYVAFLNIHTARRTYTPPSSPPSLTPKLSRLHSIFTHPDPYILKAQRILDTGHESRWATCILTHIPPNRLHLPPRTPLHLLSAPRRRSHSRPAAPENYWLPSAGNNTVPTTPPLPRHCR